MSTLHDHPDGFSISEKKAAPRIGLTRDEIRALRTSHLTEGTHYARGKQASVWLNQAGFDLLLLSARVPAEKTPPAQSPDDLATSRAKLLSLLRERAFIRPPVVTPGEVSLLVVNPELRNQRLLLACPAEDNFRRPQKTVRVRVRSAENFVRGMTIPARLVPGYEDLYELTRNCPRRKGQW